jgi:hypothetical protein
MASMTMSPEMMALVVAMAWMMLPAMPLASNSCREDGHVNCALCDYLLISPRYLNDLFYLGI